MRTLFLTLTTCLFVLPAHAAWPLYEPVAEVVLPPGDANVPRAVEEKDGYVYLLAREGILYTYDISDLPRRQSFATYNTPVRKQTSYNGNGLVRRGDHLYVFGGNGIQTIDVREPNRPVLLGLRNDLNIYNLVRYENYLIAAGAERLVVYSIVEPSNPTLLSDLNLGREQLVWSAAGYGRTLYVCHWWSDWQGSYTNTLSMIDFSNPARLSVLKAISRDDQAYHLRVIGDRLLECTSNQVGLWDLTTPADPVLLTSQQAGGRIAAQNGDHIVTNGAVLRPDGNKLQLVATFTSGGSQRDGYPHGSAVNASFVFIAQSKRVLILNARPPVLAINHASGGPGSFFTITGHGFPSKSKATILVNSHTLGDVATDAAGDCLFLLNTKQAGPGRYVVTTTAHPGTSASFVIAAGGPVRLQEGSGTILQIPPGIAYAKYSGGNGTAQDPYRIATAADLIALGETPADYDKRFLLTADIDLDPNLPGRKVFDKAVIAPDSDPKKDYFQGNSFTGVFDGGEHTISHLRINGKDYLGLFGQLGRWDAPAGEVRNLGVVGVSITGSWCYVGGLVGVNVQGAVTQCYSTGVVSGSWSVGGLTGGNGGTLTQCYNTGAVNATGQYAYAGGLAGSNDGTVTQCYSTSDVSGEFVGGLVGDNGGSLTDCYCTGAVSGSGRSILYGGGVGGLVGRNGSVDAPDAVVIRCYSIGAVRSTGQQGGGLVGCIGDGAVSLSFWDSQTSGQTSSAGGIGKTTAQMQTAKTFLDAGWDFVGEAANGSEDIWWILEGKDYPRLWWELNQNQSAASGGKPWN